MSQNLRRKLKEARAKLNLTQEQLATLLGIPKRTLISWENDQYTPKPFTLTALEEKLDQLLAKK